MDFIQESVALVSLLTVITCQRRGAPKVISRTLVREGPLYRWTGGRDGDKSARSLQTQKDYGRSRVSCLAVT